MRTKNNPVEVWGMENDVHIPIRIYASDDDLSSDGKLILCSRQRRYKDDVEYISIQWMTDVLKEHLTGRPDILKLITSVVKSDSS